MARVPISFHLCVLAGIIVLFNHYAAFETGDVALNKVTGAAGRFYTLFRDTVLTFQHGHISGLQTALCGRAVDDFFPRDTVTYLKTRYCPSLQDSESVGGTPDDRRPHGGYGGPDATFAYYRLPVRPLSPRTPPAGPPAWSFLSVDGSSQTCLSAVWDRSSEVMATIGALLLRAHGSRWWFQAPLEVTSILLGTYSALSAFGYLFGTSVVLRSLSQTYMVIVADFLRCIQWESQRRTLDVGVAVMERAYNFVTYTRKHA